VEGSREHDNKPSGSIKFGKFLCGGVLGWLSDHCCLRDSTELSELVR
jgi:hypothetical protein